MAELLLVALALVVVGGDGQGGDATCELITVSGLPPFDGRYLKQDKTYSGRESWIEQDRNLELAYKPLGEATPGWAFFGGAESNGVMYDCDKQDQSPPLTCGWQNPAEDETIVHQVTFTCSELPECVGSEVSENSCTQTICKCREGYHLDEWEQDDFSTCWTCAHNGGQCPNDEDPIYNCVMDEDCKCPAGQDKIESMTEHDAFCYSCGHLGAEQCADDETAGDACTFDDKCTCAEGRKKMEFPAADDDASCWTCVEVGGECMDDAVSENSCSMDDTCTCPFGKNRTDYEVDSTVMQAGRTCENPVGTPMPNKPAEGWTNDSCKAQNPNATFTDGIQFCYTCKDADFFMIDGESNVMCIDEAQAGENCTFDPDCKCPTNRIRREYFTEQHQICYTCDAHGGQCVVEDVDEESCDDDPSCICGDGYVRLEYETEPVNECTPTKGNEDVDCAARIDTKMLHGDDRTNCLVMHAPVFGDGKCEFKQVDAAPCWSCKIAGGSCTAHARYEAEETCSYDKTCKCTEDEHRLEWLDKNITQFCYTCRAKGETCPAVATGNCTFKDNCQCGEGTVKTRYKHKDTDEESKWCFACQTGGGTCEAQSREGDQCTFDDNCTCTDWGDGSEPEQSWVSGLGSCVYCEIPEQPCADHEASGDCTSMASCTCDEDRVRAEFFTFEGSCFTCQKKRKHCTLHEDVMDEETGEAMDCTFDPDCGCDGEHVRAEIYTAVAVCYTCRLYGEQCVTERQGSLVDQSSCTYDDSCTCGEGQVRMEYWSGKGDQEGECFTCVEKGGRCLADEKAEGENCTADATCYCDEGEMRDEYQKPNGEICYTCEKKGGACLPDEQGDKGCSLDDECVCDEDPHCTNKGGAAMSGAPEAGWDKAACDETQGDFSPARVRVEWHSEESGGFCYTCQKKKANGQCVFEEENKDRATECSFDDGCTCPEGYSREEWDVPGRDPAHNQICYTCVKSGGKCMDHETRGTDDCTFDDTCNCDCAEGEAECAPRTRAAMNMGEAQGGLCYTCTLKDTTPECDGWMQTGGCDPNGVREPESDKGCTVPIRDEWSGYCECSDGRKVMEKGCESVVKHPNGFKCADECGAEHANGHAENSESNSKCAGWKQTGQCDPNGPRETEHDYGCTVQLNAIGRSGYCECEANTQGVHRKTHLLDCIITGPFTCLDKCEEESDVTVTTVDERRSDGCCVTWGFASGMKPCCFGYTPGACRMEGTGVLMGGAYKSDADHSCEDIRDMDVNTRLAHLGMEEHDDAPLPVPDPTPRPTTPAPTDGGPRDQEMLMEMVIRGLTKEVLVEKIDEFSSAIRFGIGAPNAEISLKSKDEQGSELHVTFRIGELTQIESSRTQNTLKSLSAARLTLESKIERKLEGSGRVPGTFRLQRLAMADANAKPVPENKPANVDPQRQGAAANTQPGQSGDNLPEAPDGGLDTGIIVLIIAIAIALGVGGFCLWRRWRDIRLSKAGYSKQEMASSGGIQLRV